MGSTSCAHGGNLVQGWPGKQLCWVGPADTHVWAGDECFIPRPGGEERECPSSDRKLDTQRVPTEARWFQRHGWHRGPPAQAESVEGRVLRRHMHTHDFGDNSRDSGTTQTMSMTWPCKNPGPRDGIGPGCRPSQGVAQSEGMSFLHTLHRTLSKHRYVHPSPGTVGTDGRVTGTLSAGLRLISMLDLGTEGTSRQPASPTWAPSQAASLPCWARSTLFT